MTRQRQARKRLQVRTTTTTKRSAMVVKNARRSPKLRPQLSHVERIYGRGDEGGTAFPSHKRNRERGTETERSVATARRGSPRLAKNQLPSRNPNSSGASELRFGPVPTRGPKKIGLISHISLSD